MERKEVSILDYLFILFRARWYIIMNFIIVCFCAGAFSYVLPIYYRSTATLLPPSEGDDSFGFASAMRMLPVNISLGSGGTPTDLYIGIMKSNTVARAMIDHFDLMTVYEVDKTELAVQRLKGLSEFLISSDGLIEIRVQDQDPDRAAAMANFYWTMLDSINQGMSAGTSSERAGFMMQQIEKNKLALAEAEAALQAFQREHDVVSPLHQQRLLLSVTAELETDILQREGVLDEYRAKSFSDNHPLVKDMLQSINIRQKQLDDLKYGSATNDASPHAVPLADVSELVTEYSKLTRRTEILTQLQQILLQQYEEATIQSENTTQTVEVLDRGMAPERKFRPKRSLIVIVAGTASIFFSILSIVTIEFINHLTELTPENREKVQRLARFLRIQTS